MVCGQGGLSILHRGGIKFDGLGLQDQPNGSSVRNVFEGLFTEKEMGAGKAIFEGGFKFEASEARKQFDSTASADGGEIGERLGSDWGTIGEQLGSDQKLIGE